MIPFTEQDVINSFPASAIRKAKPYAARNVRSAQWFDNRLTGKVQGSARSPYTQTIIVRESGQGASREVTFNTTCSCPVGYSCKHSVALLLFEAARQKIAQPAAARSAVQTAPQAVVSQTAQKIQTTLYFESLYQESSRYLQEMPEQQETAQESVLWFLSANDKGHFCVNPYKSRKLKSGKWSNTLTQVNSLINYVNGYSHYRPKLLSNIDLEVIRLLYLSGAKYAHSDFLLRGTMGDLILRTLLQNNNLYMRHNKKFIPVELQAPKQLELSWQEHNGLWSLQHNLQVEAGTLNFIDTSPPYALSQDMSSEKFGLTPLLTPIHSAILKKLLRSEQGALPAEQLYDYWSPLYEVIQGLPPLPQAAIPDLQRHQPIAVLRLATMPLSRTVTQLAQPLIAGLTIRYGEVELKPAPQTESDVIEITTHSSSRIFIQRDLAFEAESTFVLTGMGLHFSPFPVEDGSLHFMPPDANMMSISARDWLPFMGYLAALQEKGWIVEIESSSLTDIDISDGIHLNLFDDDDDYVLDATVTTSAGELPILPLLLDYLAQDKALPSEGNIYLDKPDGGFIRVPVAQLNPILQAITELYDRPFNHDGQLRLSQFDVMGLNSDAVKVSGQKAQALRNVVSQLVTVTGIDPIEPPTGLQATLRDYQQQGFSWLQFLSSHNLGGVLADDMGLGKTLQVIAHLLKQHELGLLTKPALVIAPTSVVGNWMAELAKFAPTLTALRFDGANRSDFKDQIETSNVILTSYALIQRDGDFWQQIPLHSVIVDEAQYVKNPKAKTAQVIRTLKTEHCLCLTGTPLENHLGELWSLFDFVMPGFLANETQFKKRYRTPIEQHGDQACQNRLAQRVSPFMLRRTKADVVTELPAKTEIIQRVTLDKAQWQLYSSVRLSMEKRVRDLMAEKGLKRSHIEILDALLKLRQVCCDPSLVKIPAAEKVKHSAKLEVLVEMVQELTEEGRKILVFSQFATMLGIIEKRLNSEGIITSKLTGATRNRQAAVDAFVEGDAQVFLISLKAGGVGLNLTAADTVIHYDPWWNPAAEAQATDRAYRIGQDKPVFVYKLIVENTVEEKILVMQDKKRALADSVFGDEDALSVWTDSSTILNLFSQD